MKKTLVTIISVAMLASVSVVYAQGRGVKPLLKPVKRVIGQNKADWREQRQETLENLKQQKEQLRERFKEEISSERCARIEAKIQERTSNFDDSKGKHMNAYNNLTARIEKFVNRFEEFYAGQDINEHEALDNLIADLGTSASEDEGTLYGKINIFEESLNELSANLSKVKGMKCGETEGEFRSTLIDSREYLKTVHSNAAAVRSYVRATIIPDLLKVKQDIAKIKAKSSNNDSSSDGE